MIRAAFVTWDSGDTSYLESLFFPVFRELKRHGVEVSTLQLTWASDEQREQIREHAASIGLSYECVKVETSAGRRAAPTALIRGIRALRNSSMYRDVDVLLPRALVPLLIALPAAGRIRGASRPVVAWDADGLPADERVDFAGLSPRSPRYAAMRAIELGGLRSASSVMVRTQCAKEILTRRAGPGFDASRIIVVPNGRDESRFAFDMDSRMALRDELGIRAEALVAVSVGTLTPQYLPDDQARLVAEMQRRDAGASALFLTAQQDEIRRALVGAGADLRRCHMLRVAADQVPRYLSLADVGLALRERSFSQQAVSPIKVSEYLLSGLHVVASRGIGDLDDVLCEAGGSLVDGTGSGELAGLASELLARHRAGEFLRDRSMVGEVGMRHFSLSACADGYVRLLQAALTA